MVQDWINRYRYVCPYCYGTMVRQRVKAERGAKVKYRVKWVCDNFGCCCPKGIQTETPEYSNEYNI